MNRLIKRNHRTTTCSALLVAAGLATTAYATNKNWMCNAGSPWGTVACWSPAGAPGANDNVNIGNIAGVQNTSVLLNLNANVEFLSITDGMTLDTNGFTLAVGVAIDVSGRNTVGNTSFPSRLVVDQIVPGPEVFTQALTIDSQGEVQLVGGGLSIDASLDINAGSILRGAGTVALNSNFFSDVSNDGTISAGPGALTFSQAGASVYDLDGVSGGGDLDLTAASNSSLTFNGNGIFEAFGGSLSMIRGTLLQMNLANGWTVENTGTFDIYGSGSGSPARIAGAPLIFNGTINLYGGSQFTLESDITFGAASELITGLNATADIAGETTLNGGLFTVNEGSNLDFDGPTTVHGGEFITHSDQSATGSIDFNGATTWDGDISVTGFARQSGPAHVAGPTVISGDTFDMDGSNSADWDIDAYLTMNVDRIDFAGNAFNNTLDIAGRMTVNLNAPGYWTSAGTMNLAGNSILFGTRIGSGSPLEISGIVNVSGKNDIATACVVDGSSTFNIAAATSALRFMSTSLIGTATTFTGAGMLQNGGVGDMLINPGLNTSGVGLSNAGRLRVGSGPGIISVDRFLNTGTWSVDIGGPSAGTQHDRIVSNGPATLGGSLEVNLINGFHPSVADEFTILNAVGGITGSFAPNVTTTVGSSTYHWEVIIGSADVVLRLASIVCPADFNHSGTVTVQDIFDFLAAYFANSARADFNGFGGVSVQDIFDYLAAYFIGCS